MVKALIVFAVIAILLAPFLVAERARSTPGASPTPQIQTVGASVMLRLQREGAPIYDFRASGQFIPGAIRVAKNSLFRNSGFKNSSQIVLLGDGVLPRAQQLLQSNSKARVYLVPSRFVASYPDFKNVRQIEPRAAQRLMRQNNARVFDFAEHEEFEYARVAGSTRIAWTSVLQNDLSAIQNEKNKGGKPILLICPVGSRSQIVAQKLKHAGIGVLNVRGGMFAWQNAKLPVEGEIAKWRTHVAF